MRPSLIFKLRLEGGTRGANQSELLLSQGESQTCSSCLRSKRPMSSLLVMVAKELSV